MSGTSKQMVDLETIKTALKELNYPIPAELTNMLRDQMIDIETFETLWRRLSPPTVEEVCSLPTFAGLDHEDPKKFITECKNILANSNPAYWRDQIAAQFRLEPARWWSYEAPYAHSLHDLEQALIERYENFEILTKLRMKFYGITQAAGEPADAFITKKKLLATRIAPHITNSEFNGFCRMWLRDGHHLLEEPRHATTNDVVPSAPFVGEPAPRHHERPHQPRDQQPVEHQTLDEPRFNEEDATQDTTTGNAAGVLPQEAGGPRHAQDVHRDRCTQPLLEHKREEATTAAVRPEDVPTRLIDQKCDGDVEIPNAEQHPQQEPAERSGQPQPVPERFEPKKPPAEPAEHSGQPEPEPERFEPKTPPEKPPAESAERFGKQLDDDLQLTAAETTAEKHPQRQGKLALSAALPSEPGPVPGQLPKVVAVILTRPHRADRQQQPRPPQPQYDPAPRRCQPRLLTPGAQHAQEKPLPLPQQDSAVQQRQQRPPEPGARSKPLRRPPEAG
jgi:hypothetical protein